MRTHFEIEPVHEDMIRVDVAKMLGVNDSTLSNVVIKYGLGYRRDGAGNYLFLTKKDIEIIKEYFDMRKRHLSEWKAFDDAHLPKT